MPGSAPSQSIALALKQAIESDPSCQVSISDIPSRVDVKAAGLPTQELANGTTIYMFVRRPGSTKRPAKDPGAIFRIDINEAEFSSALDDNPMPT